MLCSRRRGDCPGGCWGQCCGMPPPWGTVYRRRRGCPIRRVRWGWRWASTIWAAVGCWSSELGCCRSCRLCPWMGRRRLRWTTMRRRHPVMSRSEANPLSSYCESRPSNTFCCTVAHQCSLLLLKLLSLLRCSQLQCTCCSLYCVVSLLPLSLLYRFHLCTFAVVVVVAILRTMMSVLVDRLCRPILLSFVFGAAVVLISYYCNCSSAENGTSWVDRSHPVAESEDDFPPAASLASDDVGDTDLLCSRRCLICRSRYWPDAVLIQAH